MVTPYVKQNESEIPRKLVHTATLLQYWSQVTLVLQVLVVSVPVIILCFALGSSHNTSYQVLMQGCQATKVATKYFFPGFLPDINEKHWNIALNVVKQAKLYKVAFTEKWQKHSQQPKTTQNNFCCGGIIIVKKKPPPPPPHHHHHTTVSLQLGQF